MQKERRELQAKLKSQEKKIDYYERAKRIEEIPLLQKALKQKVIQDQYFWEQQEKERIQSIIEEREFAVATRDRLFCIRKDKMVFIAKLKSERKHVYQKKLEEFRTLIFEEREKRLAERQKERKEQRRAEYLYIKQQEDERKTAEEKRQQEIEKQRMEEMTRKEKEETEREEQNRKRREHLEMLERVSALQKAKEEEIEKKLQEERDSSRGKAKEESYWRKMMTTDKDTNKKDSVSSWRASDKPGGEDRKVEIWRREYDIFCKLMA